MKKRFSKLTALVLSLAMALSLALPVTAEEEDGSYLSWYEFFYQYTEEHRSEFYETFDADAWFEEEHGWIDKETFMKYMELEDDAAFQAYMWDDYLSEAAIRPDTPLYQAVDAAYDTYLVGLYEARHPGELDRLSTAELLARFGYTKTLTPIEQYMEDWDLSEAEVRPSLLRSYAAGRLQVEADHAKALTYQESYPEQWAGFDADSWLAEQYDWWDKGEYMQLYGLLTEEEFRENMFVNYVEEQSWSWDIPWPDDEPDYSLMVNGETADAVVTMADGRACTDAATLNRILGTSLTGDQVPIRQAAEEAGWDVVWNRYAGQVILFRREDLPRGDFSRFDELMNRILAAARTEEGQSYQTTETSTWKFTVFNSLDGDKTATVKVNAELLQQDALYELTITVNASDLLKLLPQSTLDLFDGQPQNVSTLLRSCKITLLLNGETGELYFNAPILSLLDDEYSETTWFHLNTGLRLISTSSSGDPEWNTGDLLYSSLLSGSAEGYWGGWYAYYSYLQSQSVLGILLGPQSVTERGGTLTWTLDEQALQTLLAQSVEEAAWLPSIFRECEASLSADRNGKLTADLIFRLDMDAFAGLIVRESYNPNPFSAALISWAVNLLDFRMESHASGTAEKNSSTASFHWKNQFRLDITGSSTRRKTNTAPRSAPPAGAEVVELFDY